MKVPEYWWDNYNSHKLCDGKIESYDPVSQKWNLLLDARDDDDLYLMAYEAVYLYADYDLSTYHEYQLTYRPVRVGDDEIETETTRYKRTTPEEWDEVVIVNGDSGGRPIDPIEWEGGDEEFTVKITNKEVEMLKDLDGEIQYEKVFQWCCPRFRDDDDQPLFEFQVARMQNYMRK